MKKIIISIAIISLLFVGCEGYDTTNLTLHNRAFDGKLHIDSVYIKTLLVGDSYTLVIDEGLHTVDLISDVYRYSPIHPGYLGITDNVFIIEGYNEYVIKSPARDRVFPN